MHYAVAELVARERKRIGLTQAEVANRLERPQSYVASVERGQRRLDIPEFLNFAAVIGFDPRAAFGEIIG